MYSGILNELKTEFQCEDMKFAKDTQAVITYIENLPKAFASKKLYYAVLTSTIRDLKIGKTKLLRQAEEIYRAKMIEYNEKLSEIAEQQQMSEREEKIWLDWSEVLEAHSKLKEVAEKDIFSYRDYVILSLYVLLPPVRADWSPVRIVQQEDDQKDNQLVVDISGMVFVLQEYKTAKIHGVKRITIPEPLVSILREWLCRNTESWLFTTRGVPCTSEWLSSRIKAIMKRMTGKSAGINILRHSYITHMRQGEAPVLEQRNLANSMCHSVFQSQLYRRI